MLGVPPGAYEQGTDFIKRVITPAVLEVNGLSDIGIDAKIERSHRFASIETVTVFWWKKQDEEIRSAVRERSQSKVGRMAELRGKVQLAVL